MADQGNFDFLMQFAIDFSKAMGQADSFWQKLSQLSNTPIDLNIDPKLDMGAVQQQIQQLKNNFDTVTKSIAGTEVQMSGLTSEVEAAASALNSTMPKAADTLANAFKKGSKEARAELKALIDQAKAVQAQAAKGISREQSFTALGGSRARGRDIASKAIDLLDISSKYKQARGSGDKNAGILKTIRDEAKAEFLQFFGGNRQAANQALRLAGGASRAAGTNLEPLLNRLYSALNALAQAEGKAVIQKNTAANIAEEIKKAVAPLVTAQEATVAKVATTAAEAATVRAVAAPIVQRAAAPTEELEGVFDEGKVAKKDMLAYYQERKRLEAAENQRLAIAGSLLQTREDLLKAQNAAIAEDNVRTEKDNVLNANASLAQIKQKNIENEQNANASLAQLRSKDKENGANASYWIAQMAGNRKSAAQDEKAFYQSQKQLEAGERERQLILAALKKDEVAAEKKRLSDIEKANAANANVHLAQNKYYNSLGSGGTRGYTNTLRNIFTIAGGAGAGISLGFAAANTVRNSFRKYIEYQQAVANVQAAIPGQNKATTGILTSGIGQSATKYGVDILDAANAAKELASSGLDALQTVRALDSVLAAQKGMGIAAQEATDYALAIRELTTENDGFVNTIDYTGAAMDKVANLTAKYAISANDLMAGIKTLIPVLRQFGTEVYNQLDVGNALVTTITQATRTSGTRAGTSVQQMLARLERPQVVSKLQEQYGLKLGDATGKDIQPLDQLIVTLGRRYAELKANNPFEAKEFAGILAGGRQISNITALLDNYVKFEQIATTSANSWGEAQRRAAAASDTFHTQIARIDDLFPQFMQNMLDGTNIGRGLTAILSGLAGVLGGISGKGAGSFTAIAAILGSGAAISGIKKAYNYLRVAKEAGAETSLALASQNGEFLTIASVASKAAGAGEKFGGAMGKLASIFTPGGVIIGGLLLAISLIGLVADHFDRASKEATKYATSVRSIGDLHLDQSPQIQEFNSAAQSAGFGNVNTATTAIPAVISGLKRLPYSSQVSDLAGKSDADLERYVAHSTQSVQRLKESIAEAFIKTLPDDVQKGFAKITNEQDRVAQVAKLVGGAAFAANAQIADAIEGIRQNTVRLIADSISGIKDLDETADRSFLARGLFNIKQNLGIGPKSLQTSFALPTAATVRGTSTAGAGVGSYDIFTAGDYLLKQIEEAAPGFAGVSKYQPAHDIATSIITEALKEKAKTGEDPLFGELLKKFADQAAIKGSGLQLAVEKSVLDRVRPDLAEQIKVQQYGQPSVDIGEQARTSVSKALSLSGDLADAEAAKRLKASSPDAKIASDYDRVMKQLTEDETKLHVTGLNVSTTLATFRDSLINVVTELDKQARRIQEDATFGKLSGQGFDRNRALLDFGHTLLSAGNNFAPDIVTQVAKLSAQAASASSRLVYNTDGTVRLPADAKERAKVGEQIGELQKNVVDFSSSNLGSVFGGTTEGFTFLKQFQDDLSKAGASKDPVSTLQSLQKVLADLGEALIASSRQAIDLEQRHLNLFTLQTDELSKQQQLASALEPVTDDAVDKAQAQLGYEQQQYQLKRAELVYQQSLESSNKDELKRQIDMLDAQHELTAQYEAQLTLAGAQRALDQQRVETLTSMVSGVVRGFSGLTSMWESILRPPGQNHLERVRARAAAIGAAVLQITSPIFDTIRARFESNLTKGLVDKLSDVPSLSNILGTPETDLTNQVQKAAALKTGFITGGTSAGRILEQAIIEGSRVGAGFYKGTGVGGSGAVGSGAPPKVLKAIAAGIVGGVSLKSGPHVMDLTGQLGEASDPLASTVPPPQFSNIGQDAVQKYSAQLAGLAENKKTAGIKQDAAVAGGNILGSLAGGGGKGAQFGSEIGSTAGTFIPIPIVGPLLGGVVGGLLGGLFDGKKKRPPTEPIIKGLDAIERAQRDTITTISAQTDALLKPENRFFNLPSNFNVPAFGPGFFGGGGAGGGSMQQTNHVSINVNVAGGDPSSVKEAVQQAVADALFDQRPDHAWLS